MQRYHCKPRCARSHSKSEQYSPITPNKHKQETSVLQVLNVYVYGYKNEKREGYNLQNFLIMNLKVEVF